MKKEIAALALLAALLSGGLYNTHYLRTFTGGLADTLNLSRAYCENGEYALALDLAREAEGAWHARELYAGIFIRHTEIDAVSDGFYSLLGELESDEPGAAKGLYAGLIAHIESLYDMERITLRSVF